jgi:hypothetical protein
MSEPAKVVNQAMGVASYLDGIGERKRANDIRRVCRSNGAYRSNLSQLHKENRQIRATVAQLIMGGRP